MERARGACGVRHSGDGGVDVGRNVSGRAGRCRGGDTSMAVEFYCQGRVCVEADSLGREIGSIYGGP